MLSDVTCPEIFRETSRQAGARLASNAIAFNTGAEYVIVAAAARASIAGTAFDIVKARKGRQNELILSVTPNMCAGGSMLSPRLGVSNPRGSTASRGGLGLDFNGFGQTFKPKTSISLYRLRSNPE